MKVFNMKGFCYMYTLQVGLAIIAACGLTLTTISLVVNIARTARPGKEDQNDFLGKSFAQYLVFLAFVILGYVAFIFALKGAYEEEIKPLKIAIWTLFIQFVMWLVLAVLSMVLVETNKWTCVQSVRCADRFFIHTIYFRKGQGNPEFIYRTDENPSKVFNSEQDCLNYCRANKVAKHRGHAEYKRQAGTATFSDAENMTSTNSEIYDNTTTGPSTGTNINTLLPNPPGNSNATQPPSPRNGTCTCSKEERKINTLIGSGDSIVHFILSIIFTVLIALVWYLYSICTLGSYINFLKSPPRGSKGSRASKASRDR